MICNFFNTKNNSYYINTDNITLSNLDIEIKDENDNIIDFCNLSFAGLKTAILRITKNFKTEQEKFDLAASFQKTIEEILYIKSKIAFKEFLQNSISNFLKLF